MNSIIQLQPLFDEHQDGFLFTSRLREGLKNHVHLDILRKYAGWFWRNHMRPHFFQEERILLPYVPEPNSLAHKLKLDHEEILEHMIAIDREADRFELESLANLVDKHVRWEEAEFFPYLEGRLSEENLSMIHESLEKKPILSEEEWNEKFWPN